MRRSVTRLSPGRVRGVQIECLTGVIGAEVTGVDLARALRGPDVDDVTAALVAALDEHLVIVVPGQQLSPDEQVELSHHFGPPAETPFVGTMAEHPEVIRVVKEADEGAAFNFGGAWHSDFSFLAQPPSYTLLHAIDVPPTGGDTVFTSMVAALEQLPGDLRPVVEAPAARGVHTARDAYSPKLQALHDGLGSMDIRTDESANEAREHPLVCTHPTSGKRVLFFNQTYVRDLVGDRRRRRVGPADAPAPRPQHRPPLHRPPPLARPGTSSSGTTAPPSTSR